VTTAVELLKKDLANARDRERAAANDIARLEVALAALEGPLDDLPTRRQARQLEGKGIVEAAKILVREKGPQKTGDIMREAMARGWTTTSTKPIAAFYATLNGSKDFKRIDRKWHLRTETHGTDTPASDTASVRNA
jgi:hypothetical protein